MLAQHSTDLYHIGMRGSVIFDCICDDFEALNPDPDPGNKAHCSFTAVFGNLPVQPFILPRATGCGGSRFKADHPMITLIVARDRNGAIGKDNTIPWHAPEDLKAFQRETLGGAIVMGRNTWDSLPFKPLKNRLNLVVSSNAMAADEVYPSVSEAVAAAYAQGYRRVYGIGGAGIYREMMQIADRLLITEVAVTVEGADTYFPEVPTESWQREGKTELRAADPACVMVEYLRIRSDR